MSDQDDPSSLDDLGKRLRTARARLRREEERNSGRRAPAAGLGLAWRVLIEFVSPIVVGGFIGWWLDGWLGTRPWAMIVLICLGLAAGVLTIYRVAALAGESGSRDNESGEG